MKIASSGCFWSSYATGVFRCHTCTCGRRAVDYHAATVTFAMLGKLFISVCFSCIYVYSSELFPTEVRNVGLGTASMCARISSMASSYVGGPLVSPVCSVVSPCSYRNSGGPSIFLANQSQAEAEPGF